VRWLLYLLILLSGAAGLVYEVVWARQLTLFIGNTAVANAAVLTAFMAGLASGSLVLGRKADATAKPLRLYAILEILIGCYGATTPWLFGILQAGYADFAGVVGVTGVYSHIPRFLIAIAAMLLPTFMMGGTLPLLVRHFTKQLDKAQSVTSRIYGINTLGATMGAFSAGFLLLPALGITETLLFSAAVNIVVGLSVYRLLAGASLDAQQTEVKPPGPDLGQSPDSIAQPGLLLAGFALSGFAALLYQVVWIHSLVLVIGVSIYAFSTVLTVFLAGIGLGSLLAGRYMHFKNARHALKSAFYLQLGIALSAVASLSLISQLPILFVQGWAKFHQSFPFFQAYTFCLAGIVILVPTLLLGALFPLITGVWSARKGAIGRGVGEAYGANALGTIFGSAIGGLFILDRLGIEYSLYLASAVSSLVAALFWYMSCPDRSPGYRWKQLPMTAAALAVCILILPGWDRYMLQTEVFRRAHRYLDGNVRAELKKYLNDKQFLYYKEGIHGTVSVISWESEGLTKKSLMTNGKVDASSYGDMSTQILLGELPMFLHQAPEEVMVIGLGSGITAGSVLQNPAVKHLDILEISPEVVEASEFFREDNYDVLNNPRTNLIVADARNYLLASGKKYDVIISEPSHSWVTGVSNLFTREFLQQAHDRLEDDGVLVQWYHIYGIDRHSLKALLKSVSDAFSHYTLWYLHGGDIIITASNQPLRLDYQKQSAFFDNPGIRSDLERIGIRSVEQLMNNILMSSDQTQRLMVGQAANTDDHPIVEFNAPRYMYTFTTDDNIRMLFDELSEGEYHVPFVNLVNKNPGWTDVPFMGIRVEQGGGAFSDPEWKVIRKSAVEEDTGRLRLWGGMNGRMTLHESWGDVVIRTTMVERGSPDADLLNTILDSDVPAAQVSLAGELRAVGAKVYWRVGRSPQPGKLKLVLVRKCERRSEFDNWVSFSTDYPGNAEYREDVGPALQEVNGLVQCLRN